MGLRPDLEPNAYASDPKSQIFPSLPVTRTRTHDVPEQCLKEEICVSFKLFANAGTL